MQLRSIRPERLVRVGQNRQQLIFHLNQLARPARHVIAFGRHRRNRLAHPAHAILA
jgi:hypothetical protein